MDEILLIKFDQSSATLFKPSGCLVRRFTARNGKAIATASVHNAGDDSMVTINYTDGHADIYKWHGTLYRQI